MDQIGLETKVSHPPKPDMGNRNLLGNSPGNLVRSSFPEGNGFGNTDTLRNNQSGKNMIYGVVHLPSAKQTKRNGSDVLACDVFRFLELFGIF